MEVSGTDGSSNVVCFRPGADCRAGCQSEQIGTLQTSGDDAVTRVVAIAQPNRTFEPGREGALDCRVRAAQRTLSTYMEIVLVVILGVVLLLEYGGSFRDQIVAAARSNPIGATKYIGSAAFPINRDHRTAKLLVVDIHASKWLLRIRALW